MDDRRVTDAFGPCLPAFVAYVVHHIVSGGRDSPASSVSHSDVFQHLTVRGALVREASLCHVTHCFQAAPVVATLAFEGGVLSKLLDMNSCGERDNIISFILNNR